jgi:hypothetical protein
LIGFKRKIDEGNEPVDIAFEEGHFGCYVKHHKGLEKYASHQRWKKIRCDRTMPKVYIRIGTRGVGKTKWLDDLFGFDKWARFPQPTSSWWITPSVSLSDHVLIDDVGPNKVPKIEELLEWTDRYPLELNSKGGNLPFHPKTIVITSNYNVDEWWPKKPPQCSLNALKRRIYCIEYLYSDSSQNTIEYPNGVREEQEEEQREEESLEEQEGLACRSREDLSGCEDSDDSKEDSAQSD